MRSDDTTSAQKQPLTSNPTVWLFTLTASLLLGQAVVAMPFDLPVFFPFLLLVPLPFLSRKKARMWILLILLAGAAFALGYVRHERILHPTFAQDHLRPMIEETSDLYVEGVLYREPERRPDRSRWYFRTERIWLPNGTQEMQGHILITVRREHREWRYGDRLRFRLKVRQPRNYGNPGGFDYEGYLARREIYLTGFLPNDAGVERLSGEHGGLWVWIERLRREIRGFFERRLPSEPAALLKALVVGDRGGISEKMRASFVAAGVAHLLAISGLHVGMLAGVVFLLVRFAGSFSSVLMLRCNLIKIATLGSILAVLFYAALAGAMLPTVRAAIMIGVYALAVLLDREDEVLSSLCLSALIIGLYWPGAVMEISFQLSFLAVLFIILGLRKIQEWLPATRREELPQERSRIRPRLRQLGLYLAVPILATMGTGPMIAYHFGHLSLAGFVANPIVAPVVGLIVVPLGLMIALLAVLLPSVAFPFLWLAEPLLSLVLGMVRFFSALPFASVKVPLPNLLEVGIGYLVILSLFVVRRRVPLYFLLGVAALGLVGNGIYWWHERWERRDLRITYLSVGHGDAAVVELPGSKVLLIDAGGTSFGKFDTGESIVAPFLRSRRIRKVDYLLVTHPRIDHYGGMKAIVEQFAPSEFWSGPGKGRTGRYRALEAAVGRSRVKRVFLNGHNSCRSLERVKLCVLYPPEGKTGDSSVVVRLSFDRVRFLFAGDIENKDEKALLQGRTDLSSAVLKVPRHGSHTSSSEDFIAAVKPRLALFSVGQRNRYGLPQEEVLARYAAAGSEILRTDQDGAVIIETDGKRLWYRTHGSGKKGNLVY